MSMTQRRQAVNISKKGGILQLVRLASPETSWDMGIFWGPLLSSIAAEVEGDTGSPEQVGLEDSESTQSLGRPLLEDEQRIFNLSYIVDIVRSKTFRKRAVTRMLWRLGPEGSPAPSIGLKMYSIVQNAWPPEKTSHSIRLDARTHEHLKLSTVFIDEFSGMLTQKSDFF